MTVVDPAVRQVRTAESIQEYSLSEKRKQSFQEGRGGGAEELRGDPLKCSLPELGEFHFPFSLSVRAQHRGTARKHGVKLHLALISPPFKP